MNDEDIWNLVKKIRIKTIKDVSLSTSTCYYYKFAKVPYLLQVSEELEKALQINSTERIFTNVTDKTLKIAAKVFIYLSFCPGSQLLSWKQFFINLFKNFQPKMMLLNLNRIMKNSDGSIHQITESIMGKLTYTFKKQLKTGGNKYIFFGSLDATASQCVTLDSTKKDRKSEPSNTVPL